jgi:hypothetical protein
MLYKYCIRGLTLLQEQRYLGGGRRRLETKQMVGRLSQDLRNQCRDLDKFVRRRIPTVLYIFDGI